MTTEAETIAQLAVKSAGEPATITSEAGREFLILPDGYTAKDITEPNVVVVALPDFISQTVTLQTRDSLINYLNDFKFNTTRLFANIAENTILGVIDYHDKEAPNHTAHRVRLTLKHSEEWRTWTGASGKMMTQLDFARLIEENAVDIDGRSDDGLIHPPTAAEMIDIARDLHANRKVNFTKAVRTSSDNESFEYSDETNLSGKRGSVEVPTKFRIHIPVYFDGEYAPLTAFLRWKLDDGQLTLGYALNRLEHVRQGVFMKVVEEVGEFAGVPVVYGTI